MLERLAKAGRSGLSALHFAGVGGGIAVSAALVAAMLLLGHDWRSLWLASGAVSLGALLGVFVGFFLYVGGSELLPEAHRQERSGWVMVATVAGALFIYTATHLVQI